MLKKLNISSAIRRKKKQYIKNSAEYKVENFFNKTQQKVLIDIIEFKYGNNKLYMCARYDLFDKSILPYKPSHTVNIELVLKVKKIHIMEILFKEYYFIVIKVVNLPLKSVMMLFRERNNS